MKTTAVPTRKTPSNYGYINEGLSSRKTAIIIVTVVGCIAILWPKVFYPMIFGGSSSKTDPFTDKKGLGGMY